MTYPSQSALDTQDAPDNPLETLFGFLDTDNVAMELSEEKLGRIGQLVHTEFEIDKNSRADWDERIDRAMKLAMQVTEEKQYPWPGAANVKYPLLTVAAIQFASRAYPVVIQGPDVVKGKVVGNDNGIRKAQQSDSGLTAAAPPQGAGQDGPAQPPGPPQQGMLARARAFMGGGQAPQQQAPPQSGMGTNDPLNNVEWEVEPGLKRARADRVAAHMSYQLLEEMEEWEEETDKLLHALPIVGCMFRKIYFDAALGRNVSKLIWPKDLYVNYYAPSLKRAARITEVFLLYPYEIEERKRDGRFRDVELGVATGQDQRGRPAEVSDTESPHEFLEQHRFLDLDGDGYPEPYIVTIHEATSKVMRIVPRFRDTDIETGEKDEILRITPEHYYVKYGFIPNPEGGFYDVGFGWLLDPLNKAINSTLNMLLDAGHLANAGGGFIGRGLRIKGGTVKFRVGEFKVVDSSGEGIAKNIYPLPFPGPNVVLFSLLGLLIEAAQDITSVKDVLTGESQPANQPASTTLALIEQGLQVFTAIQKRYLRSAKHEYKRLYELNAAYLEDEVYFQVMDDQQAVGRTDYNTDDMDIVPVADPRSVSAMQRRVRAQFLMEFRGDPQVNQPELYERIFRGMDEDDIEILLMAQPSPNPELVAKTAELENKAQEVAIKRNESRAKILELITRAALNVAKAEGEEAGRQMDQYVAEMDAIQGMMKEENDAAVRAEQSRASAA